MAVGLHVLLCLLGAAILPVWSEWVRGVPLERQSFYVPGKDFTCLDGSATIPFEYINDDYCDCSDSSDEPGTAACPNGFFHCPNKGHAPYNLLSSRVNDGICDCCDGSDEWGTETQCHNTCEEIGRQAAEERNRERRKQQEGFQKRQEYVQRGTEKRKEKEEELVRLRTDHGLLETEVDALRQDKEEVDEPANKAKEAHKEQWEKVKEEKKAAQAEAKARLCFDKLDDNGDGSVTQQELRAHSQLDNDSDGVVGEEEARQYLDNKDAVSFEDFKEYVWDIIGNKCFVVPAPEPSSPDTGGEGDDQEEDDKDDEDEDYDDLTADVRDGEPEEPMPEYDDATKALIEVADKAQQKLEEAESRKRDVDGKIAEIDRYLGTNFGADDQFSPLYEQCFEYTDREYVYKLCMYKQVTQRSKSGGRETTLGNWESWDGEDNSVMKYTGGEKCWNGPNRSMTVRMVCGAEEAILSAGEPDRCEYAMEFATPASCKDPSAPGEHPHIEL